MDSLKLQSANHRVAQCVESSAQSIEIELRELLPVEVAHDKASVQFLDGQGGGKRRPGIQYRDSFGCSPHSFAGLRWGDCLRGNRHEAEYPCVARSRALGTVLPQQLRQLGDIRCNPPRAASTSN
jgi:hypothetical protein